MIGTVARARNRALFLRAAAILAALLAPLRAAAGTPLPPVPSDPAAAQVYRVLEARCARCHQGGAPGGQAPGGQAPAGLFGGVLDLDALARTPHLVQAGNPDGSRLFDYLLDPGHPPPAKGAPEAAPPLDAATVAAAHEWIAGLKDPMAPCEGRAPLGPREAGTAIENWLKIFGAEAARDTRFITLAHLRNECASERDLAAYRAAVDKALNSLSLGGAPARTRALDGTGALLAVRLSELGWDEARWNALSDARPADAMASVSPDLAQITGARAPVIRADWLAYAATRPSFYYGALEIPDHLADLERRLGVTRNAERHGPQAAPGAERYETRDGPAWFSREDRAEENRGGGARVVFSLPNGLPAVALFSADGRRRDGAPIDLDAPVSGDWARALGEGASPYRSALIRAGADPDLTLRGLEIVQGLARHWSEDVGAGRAAAELGVAPAELARLLDGLPEVDRPLAIRLRQGLLPRADARALLARAAKADEAPPPGEPRREGAEGGGERVRVSLTSDKADYQTGDRPRFEIETNVPCHLTFVGVNRKGFATVLFPNDFERDDKIAPETPLRIPGPSARYALRFTEKGRETFAAICETRPGLAARIRHRYVTQRFTSLGNWRAFLSSAPSPAASGKARGRRRDRARAAETSAEDASRASRTGRAAIVIDVRE